MESQSASAAPTAATPVPAQPGIPTSPEPMIFSVRKKPGRLGLSIGIICLLVLLLGIGGYYFFQKQLQKMTTPPVVIQLRPTINPSPLATTSAAASLDQQAQAIDASLSNLNSSLDSIDQSLNDKPDNFTN